MAAKKGLLEVVRYLLEQGADVNSLSSGRPGDPLELRWPPLHNAIEEGHSDVAVLLLDHGADPYTVD